MKFSKVSVAAAFVSGVVASTLCLELGLRIVEWTPLWRVLPVVERELGWPDPESGYTLRPGLDIINVKERRNKVSTNAFGMRDRSRSIRKPAGTYRVAVMGDSYTEALEVAQSETFTARLERLLNEQSGSTNFEVLNFGVIGSGPVQQLARWRHEVDRFDRDLSMFVVDEIYFRTSAIADDSLNPAYVEVDNGDLELGYAFRKRRSQRYRDHAIGRVFFFLMDHSRSARAAYLRLKFGQFTGGDPGARYRHGDESCSEIRLSLENALAFWQERQPAPYYRRTLAFLDDLTQSAGEPLAFVLYGFDIPRPECKQAFALRQQLSAAVRAVFAAYGIAVLDIEAAMFEANPEIGAAAELYGFGANLGVGHLNQAGHREFAHRIADFLRHQSLLTGNE